MEPAAEVATELIVYEQEKRLSDSLLWALQENYYSQCGLSAWNHIPFYPTSNPFIGEAYAELILGVLLDLKDVLNRNEPVYIVEMATGSGTFSFYLLKALVAKMAFFEPLQSVKIRYVMTDFTANNVEAWKSSPFLKPFLDENILDFAVFRPEEEDSLTLHIGQKVLSAGSVHNPVFAIANYFFDSIRQDLFRIENHQLKETRVSLASGVDVELFGNPPIGTDDQAIWFEKLKKTETYVETDPNYYPDPRLNRILEYYRNHFNEGSVLFPLGALRCVMNLQKISGDNLVLISSDKGFTSINYMEGYYGHNLTPHHGAFSFMVNYHAMSRYFEDQGGRMFTTQDRSPIIATAMGILLSSYPNISLETSRYFFNEKLVQQNKLNDLYYCQSFIFTSDSKSKRELFNSYSAMLRIANNDPIIFCGLADKMYETLFDLDRDQTDLLMDILSKVLSNLYNVRMEHNALFWVGKLYYGLNMMDEALAVFQQSVDRFGEVDCYSMFHLGACHEIKGNNAQALDYFLKAQAYLADCPMTAAAVTRMQNKILGVSDNPT